MKEKFGFALVNSLNESQILRETLKKEALKMFDKDYEILVYSFLETKLENGVTFEELITRHSKDFNLRELLEIEPTLTILVPELPNNSFSAHNWNTNTDIPAVAIRTNETNDIPLITTTNKIIMLPSDAIPGFPVLVVKNNERLVSDKYFSNFDKLRTRTIYRGNGVELKFWSDEFDGKKNEFYS